jgi:mannose-6-phosphate isomerase
MEENVRPWGSYDVLLDASNCKVKQITVKPGGRLSYQYHHKRSEVWVVISGSGLFTLDGMTERVHAGKVVKIPVGHLHRIHNNMEEDLVFVEVQLGSYFGEDDIVRVDDDYNRQ